MSTSCCKKRIVHSILEHSIRIRNDISESFLDTTKNAHGDKIDTFGYRWRPMQAKHQQYSNVCNICFLNLDTIAVSSIFAMVFKLGFPPPKIIRVLGLESRVDLEP